MALKKGYERLSFDVPKDIARQLKQVARTEGVSLSKFLRDFVRVLLKK